MSNAATPARFCGHGNTASPTSALLADDIRIRRLQRIHTNIASANGAGTCSKAGLVLKILDFDHSNLPTHSSWTPGGPSI
jgi:hypothetical protein